MARLIPLKLQPVLRPINHYPLAPSPNPPPIAPKSSRGTGTKMTFALPLPRSQQQWRMVLDEIRATYLRRQYRQCSIRCIELLESAPDLVLSLHCIYLSFYAAICLESLARSASIDCSEKLPLFKRAQVYYKKAESHMSEAESGHNITKSELGRGVALGNHQHLSSSSWDSTAASYCSSVTSAPHSPISCAFSSPVHSPASSVSSVVSKFKDDPQDRLTPQALCVQNPTSLYWDSTAFTRPSEDYSNSSTPRASRLFPSKLENCSSQPARCHNPAIEPTDDTLPNTMSFPLPSRSIDRCNIHLTTLRTQLKHHLLVITEVISSIENDSSSTSKPDHVVSRNKGGNSPTMFNTHKITLNDIIKPEIEDKARQRAARIAQLKQRGVDWKSGRGRFDASKYERLCEDALKEL